MSNTLDEKPPCIGERYASATTSGNLLPRMDRRTDADILLAAGIAASGNPRLLLALHLWRMRVNNDLEGLWHVVDRADAMMTGYLTRKGNRPLPKEHRTALVTDTLRWWIQPRCDYCEGRGFVVVPDTNRLSTVECDGCHGTGRRPLARAVPHRHVNHALWLTGELDKLAAVIHGRMAKLLNDRMEF